MVKTGKGIAASWRYIVLLMVLTAAGCAVSAPARAQQAVGLVPQFEVAGEYSYIRANADNSNGGFNLNGGSASFAYNFSDRLSAVGEFSVARFSGLPATVTSTMYTYVFGPRVVLRKSGKWAPFAQALLGAGRLNASSGNVSAGENAFAMEIGGGLDLRLHSRWAVRLIEANYLLTNFASASGASATQNNVRVSGGVVFRFGSK